MRVKLGAVLDKQCKKLYLRLQQPAVAQSRYLLLILAVNILLKILTLKLLNTQNDLKNNYTVFMNI